MFVQNILILGFAAFACAEPVPVAAAPTVNTAIPTDPAGISSYLASYSRLESILSGMPTLPASVESVLLTAYPSADATLTDCQTTTPAWLNSLPNDVKSALTSYESAIESWYKIHSSELGITTSIGGYGICTGGATAAATGTAKTAASTGTAAAKTTGTAASSGTVASGASGTSARAASSTSAAGAQATAVVGAGVAGIAGILGVMAML